MKLMTPPTAPDTNAIRQKLEADAQRPPMDPIRWEWNPADIAALLADNERLQSALSVSQAQGEVMREALEKIAGKFTEKHQASLDAWEGEGTAAFSDPMWVEAAERKPIAEIAKAALQSTPPTAVTRVIEAKKDGLRQTQDGLWMKEAMREAGL